MLGRPRLLIAIVLLAVLAGGCGSSGQKRSSTIALPSSASRLAPIHGHYSPSIDAANFVSTVDNPLWPLKPGTAFHYKGTQALLNADRSA